VFERKREKTRETKRASAGERDGVCVGDREKEMARERGREGEIVRERETDTKREKGYVCVCA